MSNTEFETFEELQEACNRYAEYIDQNGRPETRSAERILAKNVLGISSKKAAVVIEQIEVFAGSAVSARVKTAECYFCGATHPETTEYFEVRKVQKETGRSSGSMRYTGFGSSGGWDNQSRKFKKMGGAVSYSEGRTYYKTIEVYKCKACIAADKRAAKIAREKTIRNRKIIAGLFALWVAWIYFF